MTWLTATADELDALARRLGADRFPGVTRSVFDELPAERHPLLTERFVATLAARGLVVEQDGRVVLAPGAAALLDPVVTGTLRYVVDREDADGTESWVVAVGRRGHVVRHRATGDLHRFDLLDTAGDADAALAGLSGCRPVPDRGGHPHGAGTRAGRPAAAAGALAQRSPWSAASRSWPATRPRSPGGSPSTSASGDVRTVEPAADDDTLDPDAEPLVWLRTP